MTWPDFMPLATGVLYALAAIGYFAQGEKSAALTYLCYAGANVGLIGMAVGAR